MPLLNHSQWKFTHQEHLCMFETIWRVPMNHAILIWAELNCAVTVSMPDLTLNGPLGRGLCLFCTLSTTKELGMAMRLREMRDDAHICAYMRMRIGEYRRMAVPMKNPSLQSEVLVLFFWRPTFQLAQSRKIGQHAAY